MILYKSHIHISFIKVIESCIIHCIYIYTYHISEPDIVCHVSHHDLPKNDSSVSVKKDVFAIRSLMVWCIDPFGSASWRKHEKDHDWPSKARGSKCSAVDLCAWYVYIKIYIYIYIYVPAYYFFKYLFKNCSSSKNYPSQIEENEVSEMHNKIPIWYHPSILYWRGCQCPAWRTLHSGEFQCQWLLVHNDSGISIVTRYFKEHERQENIGFRGTDVT